MDQKMLTLFCAAVALGLWRAYSVKYRAWRDRRFLLPAYERNAGFVTDTKLLWFERSLSWSWWALVAVMVVGTFWVLGVAREWWCWPYCPPTY